MSPPTIPPASAAPRLSSRWPAWTRPYRLPGMNRWRSDTLVTFQVIVATPLSDEREDDGRHVRGQRRDQEGHGEAELADQQRPGDAQPSLDRLDDGRPDQAPGAHGGQQQAELELGQAHRTRRHGVQDEDREHGRPGERTSRRP